MDSNGFNVTIAGRRWKTKEIRVLHVPAGGAVTGSGGPGPSSLCVQPEVSVETQPGEGNTKYCFSTPVTLMVTVCR